MANTDHLFWGLDFDPNSTEPLCFIETCMQYLSPFSAHEVALDGVTYKSAEHAYQALRIVEEARGAIMSAKSPMDAWRGAQKCKERGEAILNCDKDALMEKIFRAKLAQHPDIEQVLRITGTRELLKNHDTDYYWGIGADGSGENRMGKLWMKLRAELP